MQDLTILDSDSPAIVAIKKSLSTNVPLIKQSTHNQVLNFILTLFFLGSTIAWVWVTLFWFSSVISFILALFTFWVFLGAGIYALDEMFCDIPEQIRRAKVKEETRINNIIDKENRELLAKQEAEALEAKEILRQRNEEENAQLMNEALKFYLLNKKGE